MVSYYTVSSLAQETGMSESSVRMATQLLKPSGESWCLVCCKWKNDCCTYVFNVTITCEKYLHVERAAYSTPPAICEL
jgi:hypothetical protein